MAALFNCGIVVNNAQPMFAESNGIGTMLTTPSPGSFSQEDTSSNMSTHSSTSGPNLSPSYGNVAYLAPEQDGTTPYLRLKEQPVDKFRFRYKSEMMGTHGSILGKSADRIRKRTYPTVELCNYNGDAIIRCSLYTADPDESMRSPHTHRLIVRVDNEDRDDPHEVMVSAEMGYTAVFQGMGIIHTAKRHIAEELIKKKKLRLLEAYKTLNNNLTSLSQKDEIKIRTEAEQEAKKINLNVVTLRFEALIRKNGIMFPIGKPLYSQPISNMKSALTGELKICRIDKYTSSCLGNEEVFILVEKVGKKNIKVKFYELDDEDNEVWCDYGKFSELDVHHQYAIVFRTPPYRDTNIDKQVDVFVQLYRPTDGDCSDPIRFVYKPSEMTGRTRKRARTSLTEEIPMCIPTAVVMGTVNHNPVLGQSNGIGTNGVIPNLPSDLDVLPTPPSLFEQVLNEAECNSDFEEFMKNLSIPSLSSVYCGSFEDSELNKDGSAIKESHMMHICTDGGGNFGLKYRKPGVTTLKADDTGVVNRLKSIAIGETKPKTPPPVKKEVDPERLPKRAMAIINNLLSENPSPEVLDKTINEVFSMRTQDDDNPLHCAVLYDQRPIMKQMVSMLAKGSYFQFINAYNGAGLTPLHIAVMQNQSDYVKLLLKSGADPRKPTMKEGSTAVHLAVEKGHDNCLSAILSPTFVSADKYPFCDARDDSGNTPLHLAARKGNLKALRRLIEMGEADINCKDLSHGRTVLHIAVEEMNKAMVEHLLERSKIKVDEVNYDGNTALHLACVVGEKGSAELCKLLLQYQADPHKTNYVTKDKAEMVEEGLDKELVEVKMEPDSDEDDDDDDFQLKIESGEEDDDQPKVQGQSSFDLASENKEIMDILNKAGKQEESDLSINITVKEEPVDVPILDDILGEVKNGLFDEETLSKISSLLDMSGSWLRLAELLDYGFLTASIKNASSPTRMLLNYADLQGCSNIEDIRKFLKDLKELKAVEVMDKMLAQKAAAETSL